MPFEIANSPPGDRRETRAVNKNVYRPKPRVNTVAGSFRRNDARHHISPAGWG